MALIVDASVALKWVIEEDGSGAARRLLQEQDLAAPDLLFIECANVLRTKVRRDLIPWNEAKAALEAIDGAPIRSIPTRNLVADALSLAFELGATAYDSLYLAAAVSERSTLVTADEAFARLASAIPAHKSLVRLLSD